MSISPQNKTVLVDNKRTSTTTLSYPNINTYTLFTLLKLA